MPLSSAPVYDAVAELGSAYELPSDWSWLKVDPECRLLRDPAAAWKHLQEQFPEKDLLAARIARKTRQGLMLTPVLTANDPGFIVLRGADGTAFDIVTAAGCVSGIAPVLSVYADQVTRGCLKASAEEQLFATFSMLDTVLLRSLKVAAAPAAQLEHLDWPGLKRLSELVGEEATEGIGGISGEAGIFDLILLAGSVAARSADIPARLPAVVHHLASAQRHLGLQLESIRVAYPSPENLENLRYRWQIRAPAAIRQFFPTALPQYSLDAIEKTCPPVPLKRTRGEQYLNLLTQQLSPSNRSRGVRAILEGANRMRGPYDDFVEREFVQPVVDEALESHDPETRTLLVQAAGLVRLYHHLMPALMDTECRSAKELRDNDGQFIPREAFRQLDQLVERTQKLFAQHAARRRRGRGRRR